MRSNHNHALELSSYSAFAFDFDGTLADTTGTHNEARLQAFEHMAKETGDARFVQVMAEIQQEAHRHGSNPTSIIGWTLQTAGLAAAITDPMVARTVDLKNEAYLTLSSRGLEQIPNAVEFLRAVLSLYPERVGITTTAYRAEVLPFMRRYNLYADIPIDKLITKEDVGPDHMKPDPYAYQITLGRFGLTHAAERLLVFEDTPGGILAANRAGATTVALCTTHSEADFGDVNPTYLFSDFRELQTSLPG